MIFRDISGNFLVRVVRPLGEGGLQNALRPNPNLASGLTSKVIEAQTSRPPISVVLNPNMA